MTGGNGKNDEKKQLKDADKARPPKPRVSEDDDYEDGDIATPKRDRHGDDDEPLA